MNEDKCYLLVRAHKHVPSLCKKLLGNCFFSARLSCYMTLTARRALTKSSSKAQLAIVPSLDISWYGIE